MKKGGLQSEFGFHIGRPFYIITAMGSGRAIEVTGGRNLVLKTKKYNHVAQQFYFDNATKTIKSQQYKDRSIDIQNAGSSSNLQIWSTNGRWFQMFRLKGQNIVNEHGKVFDVSGGQDRENQNIIVWNKHNGLNQRWNIVYADQDKEEPKDGEFLPDFGVYAGRHFYVQTRLESGRYIDIVGNAILIKTPNGFDTQKWYFDLKTKTIKSVARNNVSWDIRGSGKTREMQVWSTNSGWWQLFRYDKTEGGWLGVSGQKAGWALTVNGPGGYDKEGQTIQIEQFHRDPNNGNRRYANQQWNVLYCDQVKEQTKGEINKEFGFWPNRPFYIQSDYINKGVLTLAGSSAKYQPLKQNDQNQLFFFDPVSKTLKSQRTKT